MSLESVSYEDGALTYRTSGGMSLEGRVAVTEDRFTGTLSTVGNREKAGKLMALIRSLVDEFKIDEKRIYITGQSMGGGGTWGMLAFYPEFFAAAAPVCGTGDLESAPAVVAGGTAIWAFHGGADSRVPTEASRSMIAALRAAGGRPKYTEYPGVKHDSWVDAYPEPALSEWMFEQARQP
jgi:predicted peptidase